jgi:hypothetical protein
MTQSVGNKLDPSLFVREIQDKYIRKNFERLAEYFKKESQFLGFRFVEIVATNAEVDARIAHGLGYLPKDLVRLSVTGSGTITWHYSKFTTSQLVYTVTGSVRVRLLVGSYRRDASPNAFSITDVEEWVADTSDSSDTLESSSSVSKFDILNLGLSAAGNGGNLTIKLKQADGSTDPSTGIGAVIPVYRSLTLTSGEVVKQSFTSEESLSVSKGATLGYLAADNTDVYVYSVYNGVRQVLAVTSRVKDESSLHTTVAMSSSADSAVPLYSTQALAGCVIRLLGRVTVNAISVAGTWTDPDEISIVGTESNLARIGDNYEANSSSFPFTTAGYASGEWCQFTGNSLRLTPGRWYVSGKVWHEDGGANTVTTATNVMWATVNGDNTSTSPTDVDNIFGGDIYRRTLWYPASAGAYFPSHWDFFVPNIIADVDKTTDVYLNFRWLGTTKGDGAARAVPRAVKIQDY